MPDTIDAAPARPRPNSRPKGRSGATGRTLRRLAVPLTITLAVVGLVLTTSLHWDSWMSGAATQTTDNAYVQADTARLSARVAGNIRTVLVKDFQPVHAGDLLMEIVPDDYVARREQAAAAVENAQAALITLESQVASQRAAIQQAQANRQSAHAQLVLAKLERTRQEALLHGGLSGTAQRVEQAVAAADSANASLTAGDAAVTQQQRQVDVIAGQIAQAHAQLAEAEANLKTASLDLAYTRIVAPFDGVVSESQVRTGEYVTIGSGLVSVVPLPKVYVTANYKETQLTHMRPGQPVDIRVDTFPGQSLLGHVDSLSPASGSEFALLPADNASGNFTKVVQRVPVRITLDPDQPLIARLRPGMSVETTIHVTQAP